MFGSLDISTSALVAQRTRLDVISGNLANEHSVFDADGNYAPYRRRIPVFSAGDPATGNQMGVHISEIQFDDAPFKRVHEPGHPAADADGYVQYPNINRVVEMVNGMEALRAYEANITVVEATKSMINQALRLLA